VRIKIGYDKLLNKLDEQSYHAESKIDKKEYIKIKNSGIQESTFYTKKLI